MSKRPPPGTSLTDLFFDDHGYSSALRTSRWCLPFIETHSVVGLSLSEALQTFEDNDFSSVSYSAVSGDSIWDTDNWKVISQSIDAGTEREADQKIELQTGETPQSETQVLETQAPETQAPEIQTTESFGS